MQAVRAWQFEPFILHEKAVNLAYIIEVKIFASQPR
jgi:hypothetical protein